MPNQNEQQGSGTSNRGFASMDEDKQREIASKGGSSVDAEDRSFSKDPELAAEAGRMGGQASGGGNGGGAQASGGDQGGSQSGGQGQGQGSSGNFANDPERASEAGRKGGESSGGGER